MAELEPSGVAETSGPVSIGQLCANAGIASLRILAGRLGLDRTIEDVSLLDIEGAALGDHRPGCLYVLDGRVLEKDSYQVDLALRRVFEAGGSGLFVGASTVPISTASLRLADRFGFPLVQVDSTAPLSIIERIRRYALAYREVLAATVLDTVDAVVAGLESGVAEVLAEVGRQLNAEVCLLSAEGHVVAGSPPLAPIEGVHRIRRATVSQEGAIARAIVPIWLGPDTHLGLWLLADAETAPPRWAELSSRLLQLAAWATGSILAAERLSQEKDARVRSNMLDLVLAARDDEDPALGAQLAVLGWRFDGWCTAVYIRMLGEEYHASIHSLTEELTRELKHQQLGATVVERPDGWCFWLVSPKEPPVSSYLPLRRAVRETLERFVGDRALQCRGGVGRPYRGIAGMRRSVSEAREAMTVASGDSGADAVQHIDELGMRRMLFGWYSSRRASELADALLEPLFAADPAGELAQTLECYLDHESSATRVAELLDLHRNTVIKRIERIRAILAVDLEDPDNRLALQLAFRVERGGIAQEAEQLA